MNHTQYSNHTAARSKMEGVTLVELMVALVVSAIVLLAVSTVYVSTRKTYNVQQQFSQMQEGALYAFQSMTKAISNAGYAGCNPTFHSMLTMPNSATQLYDYRNAVYGWEYTGTGPGSTYNITSFTPAGSGGAWTDNNSNHLDAALVNHAIPGSDVIVIKSTQESSTLARNYIPSFTSIPGTAKTINFPNATGIVPGTMLLMSDCTQTDLFINTAAATATYLTLGGCVNGATICNSASAQFTNSFLPQDARYYYATSAAYYIGWSQTAQAPALFRYNYSDPNPASRYQELVDGVENMQVLYGENANGPQTAANGTQQFMANHYVTFDKVANPTNIYAVRISLLLRSADNANVKPKASYQLGATPATAVNVIPMADTRLRKVFTTTIALHNMTVSGR